ncbi:MAG: hypothetical protein M1834_006332 [Cirrosporium novae-zelandiae]|nr:MAG: hypothetical protein M1834_006332 [Cirrosporium novae-zelandiae]
MPHSLSSEKSIQHDPAETNDSPAEEHPANNDTQATSADAGVQMKDTSQEESKAMKDEPDSGEEEKLKLDDMFDGDSDSDEFMGSSAKTNSQANIPKSSPIAAEPMQLAPSGKYSDPEIMYAFYSRLFPFRYLFQWLNHGIKPAPDFGNREFAFTLQNDAYLRYQSFPTADLLRKEILRLNPSRFEIGPQYTTNPRDRKMLRKSTVFRPLAKELVFDIDLTDYDEIRTCCDKTNICHKCWSFITMAIKVMDAALRDDFGFRHIMWVYSGRRGAHCWVSDKKAREMDDAKRRALAGYLELIKGGSQSGKKVKVKRPLHPHVQRSLDILKEYFPSTILQAQNPFHTPTQSSRLLTLLPDAPLNTALQKKWDSAPGRPSTSKWADIDALAKAGSSKSLDPKALLEAKQDIVLEYTYPRLDVEVSKKQIHLLKSPFVVHPGTGRVCVPIDVSKTEEFDPLGVPTVTQLLGEIDAWDKEHGSADSANSTDPETEPPSQLLKDEKKILDYEKTSLKPYVEFFKAYVSDLLRDERPVKREREESSMEF